MNKWHEVTVTSTKSYMVEIEEGSNEDPAVVVTDELFSGDWDEAYSSEVPQKDLESYLRHTDKDKIFSL